MYIDIPWPIGLTLIALEILFLYGLTKHYERQLDEEEKREQAQLEQLQNYE